MLFSLLWLHTSTLLQQFPGVTFCLKETVKLEWSSLAPHWLTSELRCSLPSRPLLSPPFALIKQSCQHSKTAVTERVIKWHRSLSFCPFFLPSASHITYFVFFYSFTFIPLSSHSLLLTYFFFVHCPLILTCKTKWEQDRVQGQSMRRKKWGKNSRECRWTNEWNWVVVKEKLYNYYSVIIVCSPYLVLRARLAPQLCIAYGTLTSFICTDTRSHTHKNKHYFFYFTKVEDPSLLVSTLTEVSMKWKNLSTANLQHSCRA